MPTKSQKAALRQAKLRQRRRRGRGAEQEFDAGPSESQIAAREAEAAESSPVAAAPTAASVRPARRTRQRPQSDETPRYEYLGAEVRRIAAISVLIFALLGGATFLLGG